MRSLHRALALTLALAQVGSAVQRPAARAIRKPDAAATAGSELCRCARERATGPAFMTGGMAGVGRR